MNYFKRIILLLTSLMISLSLVGQDADKLTDNGISNAVEEELLFNATAPSYLIDAKTFEGIVTLSGTVNNILERDRAVKVARTVKGVRGVINKIEVKAPEIPDDELKQNVYNAILSDPATELYEINARAENGHITLTGNVDSWQEKKLAAFIVKGVRGVKSINNQINIDSEIIRSDDEIEKDVERSIQNDVRVDGALIDVKVNNATVFLSGTVGSASEKMLAKGLAYTSGVIEVDHSDLEVKKWARNDEMRTKKYLDKSDKEIKDAIMDAYLYDPRVASFNIDVVVDDGAVTLTGEVDNLKAKKAAKQDAKNIVGVTYIKNYVKVRPTEIPENEELETKVSIALENDPAIDRWDIQVTAKNGVIFLNGTVDSYYAKFHVNDLVSKEKGVVAIENNLAIYDDNDRYYYTYYDWNSYYAPQHVDVSNEYKEDEQIRKDIINQLFWSPYVNESEVDVTVVDGTAILKGIVDTYRERKYAEVNAFEGGAKKVKNYLDIEVGENEN